MPAGISENIWSEFTAARADAAEAVSKDGTADDYWTCLKDLTFAQQKLDAAKSVVTAKDQILNTSHYSGKAFETMKTIIDDIAGILANPDTKTGELIRAKETLNNVIKADQIRTQLKNELAAAEKQLANTAGYTASSVNALKSVAAQAQAMLKKLDSADADAYLAGLDTSLKDISGALSALKSQKLVKEAGIDEFSVNGMTYKVLDANTVKLTGGADKNSIIIPNAVTGSDNKAYQVTVIGNAAFKNKSKIKKVTINANITTIEKNAFMGCKKLANVVVKNKSKLKSVGKGAFKKTSSKIKIKLPKNLKNNKKLKKQLKKAGIKRGL